MEGYKIDDIESDRIAQTFIGKSILVTGGTGFLGKVLIEKLLRCMPIKHIYMIIRPKKNKDSKQRLNEIFNSPLFDLLKKQKELSTLEKMITIVNGDMEILGLGLSPEDKKMLCENVNIVYHSAATVRFDETLKKAILLNTRGTLQMIELAKEIKNLILFTYISTAYCHLNEKILREKTYPPPADPHKIIKCIEWMDDDVIEIMTKKILGNVPNTYAFSKALAESIVEESMPHIPSVIIRPSVIVPIWKEPLPGWTDNINGPTGLLIGAGKGVIRSMYINESNYVDFMPVDVCINVLLVLAWYIVNQNKDQRVYNCTSSSEFKVSWTEILDRGRKITQEIPLNGIVWYPGGSMKKSRLLHNICDLFFHAIPAYIIDALIFLAGYKPVMYRVRRRMKKGFEIFDYYANNQWDFDNSIVLEVRKLFNNTEYEKYNLHGNDLDIDEYFGNCIRAARLYILNEPLDTLPAARRHLRVMYWVDVFTKIFLFLFVIYILASWSETFITLFTKNAT